MVEVEVVIYNNRTFTEILFEFPSMKTDSKYPQQPRYDLYIVTENVGETEDSEVSDRGHLNASYAASDTDERLRTEERLRVEITDQPAPNKDSQEEDGIVLKPVKVSHSPLFV